MTPHKDSPDKSSRRGTLLAGLAAIGALGVVRKAKAAQQLRAVGAPMIAHPGERLTIQILNEQGNTVIAHLAVLNANDSTVLASSAPVELTPGMGSFFDTTIPALSFVAPVVALTSPRDFATGQATGIKAAAQLFSPTGQTMLHYEVLLTNVY